MSDSETTSAAAKKPARPKPSHPTYLVMAKEAITALADRKGATVQAIVTYISGTYNLETDTVRQRLKPALARGMEEGYLVRPKDSDAKGFTGRFRLDKTKLAEEEKAKKQKEKLQAAKEKKEEAKPKAKATVAKKSPKKKADGKAVKTKAAASKAKKTPVKGKKAAAKPKVTKKPIAAKATLKTPLKTPKKLKTAASSKRRSQ
ncbi:H1-like protein [Mya arenaria]|uniref:H1-like protein n=1 Tax=Mya arenaria TaxID=6604 RepID=A0ABY7DHK7_MYAAR|nr:histone H1-like [Mya arenaria]WAQ96461.1 H1-like protein [Mya arenaria]